MAGLVQVYTSCSNYCQLNVVDDLTDINECSNNRVCGNDKNCVNNPGSYSCVCKNGYQQLSDGSCQGMDQ